MAADLKFCPRCAGALEWRAIQYPDTKHPVCVACGFVLWQNRKPSVEALIARGEGPAVEMLLGRLAVGASKGLWDLPRGFLNAGDRVREALVRECRREMDVAVGVGDLLGVFEDTFYGIPLVSIVFVCSIVSGTPRAADLIDDVRWFPVDRPPRLAFPAVSDAIGALQRRDG